MNFGIRSFFRTGMTRAGSLRSLTSVGLSALAIAFWWALFPCAVRAQYLAYSFKANPNNGQQIYKSDCAACHGADGKGAPQTLTVFKRPSTFPDFSRCDQTTAETNTSYKATIANGGPNRGFSQI